MRRQDSRDPPDIAKRANVREILGRERRYCHLRLNRGIAGHRSVENRRIARVLADVLEDRHPELAHEPVLASIAQYRHKVLPYRIMLRSLYEQRHRF